MLCSHSITIEQKEKKESAVQCEQRFRDWHVTVDFFEFGFYFQIVYEAGAIFSLFCLDMNQIGYESKFGVDNGS